jgi:hypothetical protein
MSKRRIGSKVSSVLVSTGIVFSVLTLIDLGCGGGVDKTGQVEGDVQVTAECSCDCGNPGQIYCPTKFVNGVCPDWSYEQSGACGSSGGLANGQGCKGYDFYGNSQTGAFVMCQTLYVAATPTPSASP